MLYVIIIGARDMVIHVLRDIELHLYMNGRLFRSILGSKLCELELTIAAKGTTIHELRGIEVQGYWILDRKRRSFTE